MDLLLEEIDNSWPMQFVNGKARIGSPVNLLQCSQQLLNFSGTHCCGLNVYVNPTIHVNIFGGLNENDSQRLMYLHTGASVGEAVKKY